MRELGLFCMIALDREGPLDMLALRRAIPQAAPGTEFTIERRRATLPSESAAIVTVGRSPFVVYLSPGRMPEREYRIGTEGNLIWPSAADEMARHVAVATVCAATAPEGQTETVAQAAELTRLAAAVAMTLRPCGVYWAGTRHMSSPQRLIEGAAELERRGWPVDLWLGYRVTGEEPLGGPPLLGAETLGASAYLGCEVSLAPTYVEGRFVPLRRLFEAIGVILANHGLIDNGMVIETGNGVFRVSLEDSGRGPIVARLQPGADGPRTAW